MASSFLKKQAEKQAKGIRQTYGEGVYGSTPYIDRVTEYEQIRRDAEEEWRQRQNAQFQAERNAEIAEWIKGTSPLELENERQQQRLDYRPQYEAQQNRNISEYIKSLSPLEIEKEEQQRRIEEQKKNSQRPGPYAHTPETEAQYLYANGVRPKEEGPYKLTPEAESIYQYASKFRGSEPEPEAYKPEPPSQKLTPDVEAERLRRLKGEEPGTALTPYQQYMTEYNAQRENEARRVAQSAESAWPGVGRTAAGMGANFISNVGQPIVNLDRGIEGFEDMLYRVTGNERFNLDREPGLRNSEALKESDEFAATARDMREKVGSLGQQLIDSAGAAGNMLSSFAFFGMLGNAAGNPVNATARMANMGGGKIGSALGRLGARAGIEILSNPGNFGISLGSAIGSYSEAYAKGAGFGQAMTDGLLKGMTEYYSNKLFSGTPFEDSADKGYVTKLIERAASDLGGSDILKFLNDTTGGKVINWAFDKAGEGLEEVVTGVLDPMIDRITYDRTKDLATVDELTEEFIGGVLLSFLMEGGEAVISGLQSKTKMTEREAEARLVKRGVDPKTAKKYAKDIAEAVTSMLEDSQIRSPEYDKKSIGNPETAANGANSDAKAMQTYAAVFNREDSAKDLRRGANPAEVDQAAFLTENEAKNYFYIWNNQGAEAADAFYEQYLTQVLEQRRNASMQQYIQKAVREWQAEDALMRAEARQREEEAQRRQAQAEEAPTRTAPATLTLPTVAEQQERSTPPVPQQAAQERETPQTLTAPTVAERQERETPKTLTLPTVENRTAETEEQMIERLKKAPAGLAQDEYTATLDQSTVKLLDTLAKKLGLRVAFADEVNRGKANADITGNVVLLEKGNPNPVRFLIGHEATHWMKRNADGGYNAFEKAARKADAVWFANREAEIRRVYQQQGINIDDAGIREEAVSDYAGLLADNFDTLERFITENRDDRGAMEKVRDFFRHVKEFLTGDERAKVERAERRLLQALQQTERNVAEGKGAYQGNNTQQSIKSNIDGTQAAGYNNKLTGGVQNGGAQEGTAGAELDGTSGERVSERQLLRAGRGTPTEGRALGQGDLSASGVVRLSDSSRQLLNDRSVGTVEMEYSTDHAAFSALLDEARTIDKKNGWAVTPKTVEELENGRTFLSADGGVGFALAPNGDIEAVFRNKQRHPQGNAMRSVLPQAIANGGTKLDCYGSGLAQVYAAAAGMVPVCRVAFDPNFANPGWTADKGEPDIVFMMVTDTDPDTIIQKQGTYHLPTVEEIAELPLFTGPTGYDDAAAYRDRLLEERIGTGNTEGETKRSLKGLDADAIPESVRRYGRIQPGEKPARDVQVPKKVTEDKSERVSQTIRTVLEAGATPDTAVPTISELVEKGAYSYQVYSDKDAIAKAEDTIKDKGWEATLTEWVKDVSDGTVNKTNTALGWALYNNAANKGDLDTALNVLDLIVRHQRNAAQAVQATRILKQLTPEAQLYGVQRSVDNLIAEIKQKYGKDVDIQVNRDLARAFLNAETEADRRKALTALYKDVGRQLPSRFIDKWNAWRYLMMLGNLRTHGRNIGGNAGFAPVVLVKDQIGTMLESIVYQLSGGKTDRTKGLVLPGWDHKLVKAAWDRYDEVMDEALGGGKYTEQTTINDAIEQGRVIFKFKPLEAIRRFNRDALDKEDIWFNKPHYVYAMAQYCKANDITPAQIASGKGLEKADAYAIKEAQKATYRDINAFSNFVSSIGRSTDRKTPVGKVASAVIEGNLPFRRTPANVLARGVEYSPLGLAKSLTYDMYQVMKKDAAGNPRMAVSEMLDNVSAGLTGTGLLALGMLLAKLGLLRGHGEDDEKARNFDDLTGHQNYAVQLPNGDSYTLDWLAPESLPVFVGVNLYERMLKAKGDMKMADLLEAISGISEPMLEMSMLQGINNTLEAISFAKSHKTSALTSLLASSVTSYLTQAFPTLLGQFERTGENVRMTTYTDKNKWLTPNVQYSLGKVSAKVPGWDYDQIPYIDAWGRTEVTGDGWLGRAFKNMISPGYTDKVRMSDMEKELLRLYNVNPEDNGGVLPTRPERKIGDTDLTGEQYVQYATKKGQLSYELAEGIIKSAAYKKATDAERVKMIKDAFVYADERGKAEALPGYKPSENRKWTAEMYQTVKTTKVDEATYLSARYETSQIEGIRDDKGETISNSAGLKKMDYLYGLTNLTESQRGAMMADFGISDTLLETVQSKDDVKGMLEFIDADIPASEYKDYKIASGVRGIDLNLYMKGYNAYYDADGSGTKTNADWTAVLDKQTFSKDEAQDSYIKGVLWQLYTNSTSTKNNPYDKSGGQYVLDEKDKAKSGGSGSGQYARANLPTLKLPTVEPVPKRNTGRLELPTI